MDQDQLLQWKRNWPAHGAILINLCTTFSVIVSTAEPNRSKNISIDNKVVEL